MNMISHRRICWPDPDATCLNGGCGYCNDHPFRSLRAIRAYADTVGMLRHRALGEQDALEAYRYGLRNAFFNAETKTREVT